MTETEAKEIRNLIKEMTRSLILNCSNASNKYTWKLFSNNPKLLEEKTEEIRADIQTLKSIQIIILNNDLNLNIVNYFKGIIARISKSEYLDILKETNTK